MTASKNYSVEDIRVVGRSGNLMVREFTVTAGQEVPWHQHTEVTDHCYGLEGAVRVQCSGPKGEQDFTLAPGKSCTLEPGTRHRLTCGEGAMARYLLVQVGAYDFVKVPAPT
jgi:quercetin dioxygenase-like cupin family protein